MNFPSYYGFFSITWFFVLRTITAMVLIFLILPILIVIPLSFNAEPFFSFTKGMLALDSEAYSLRWYEQFLADEKWNIAIKNSFYYATTSTILATILGTLAAVGLSHERVPFRGLINAILISPMIVPLVIIAAGMYFFYSFIGIAGTNFGLIAAHTVLGTPFVVITVGATLVSFDKTLVQASKSLGASPLTTFFKITFPLVRPGIISGALFAFITSFDEVVLIIFLAAPDQRTLPRQMFSGLREQINPTILAVATLLIFISICLLVTVEMLRRRSAAIK